MNRQTSYENIQFSDAAFPVIFHFDHLKKTEDFMIHWQNDLELLYLAEGSAQISSDHQRQLFTPGQIAVINCTSLHSIQAVDDSCSYYCLIVGQNYLEQQGIPISDVSFQFQLDDPVIRQQFEIICREMNQKLPYYKTAVKSAVLSMGAQLCRHFSQPISGPFPQDRRLSMVKSAVSYIQKYYDQPLSIDSISAAIGFSKYYFCRTFKEITGRTVIDYLNLIRCSHAHSLLISGSCNVSESAEQSGFQNLSYFSKTYRRYFGCNPSEQERER
ncbi:MAG: AraC family transcriptional regulator [Massiliimalia sp.]